MWQNKDKYIIVYKSTLKNETNSKWLCFLQNEILSRSKSYQILSYHGHPYIIGYYIKCYRTFRRHSTDCIGNI